MSSNLWTPEIIATIVYRVIMILVSLAFIWKQYRQTSRYDEEQFIGILLPTHTPSAHLDHASSATHLDQVKTSSAPRLRDYIKAHSEMLMGITLGGEATSIPSALTSAHTRDLSSCPEHPIQVGCPRTARKA